MMKKTTARIGFFDKGSPASRTVVLRTAALTSTLLVAGMLLNPAPAYAAELPVDLGTAEEYSVLGGTAITSGGATVLSGSLGLSPGTVITEGPPIVVGGETHIGIDPEAVQARADFLAAYADATGRAPTEIVTGDLFGRTLNAGVYSSPAALALTGTLTLDGQGALDSVFIFQVGSALTTGAVSQVVLINGAQACHVYWAIGSAATLGAASSFTGTIMAQTAVTVGGGTDIDGRVLAGTAVTLAENDITASACLAPPAVPSVVPPGTGPAPPGELAATGVSPLLSYQVTLGALLLVLGSGLLAARFARTRSRSLRQPD